MKHENMTIFSYSHKRRKPGYLTGLSKPTPLLFLEGIRA
jgi:hypothetical protein